MEENVPMAFMLTILAGLATGIGSTIAFFVKDKSTKLLTFAMGFAAGVMLYVSFIEILPEAIHKLIHAYGDNEQLGTTYGVVAFFVGMLVVAVIDKLIPEAENPHEFSTKMQEKAQDSNRLMRIGVLTALALAIHNFPEGIATFVTALDDPELGLTIAMAIAIHNIPEGIAVSMPIYFATGDRKKAFAYSFLSGIVEPLGAVLGYFLLMDYLNETIMGLLLSGVAGIMVFISLDQLLPAAEEYGEHHLSIYGVVLGMIVMAASLILMI
ncbi:zinc transporter ZupT [Aureispira anguillae]|uniref:Zinc transporter ZupT n=1 Tax=Aureispira anguillae TaxID=2864201 RepID=A0A915YLC0_9BACT|nr:zinc transporter ZupT [Aureispira anguillae]BDS15046.1 zinc transporter ZupT [Aureispira anguillae]